MATTWLADAEPETCWAHRAWPDFAALPQKESAVVVLPLHGLADHGASRPLDVEELLGGALLRRAVEQVKAHFVVRVLPPLRFLPASGTGGFFEVDPETAHDLVAEMAASVKAAGFHKLVFLNTSSVNEPFVATAALDARAGSGLRTYVIHTRLLGLDPARHKSDDVAPFAAHLAKLLTEIRGHLAPPPSVFAADEPAPPVVPATIFPACRSRYLPAFTSLQLAAVSGNKDGLVIVPTGAIEQHGPHLPVGVDAILGQVLLDAALRRLPPDFPVFVAPPVTCGKSIEHREYAGTVSLSTKTLRRLVLAVAEQISALGLRRLALLNTHGGNSAVLASVLREIKESLGLEAFLLRPGHAPDLGAQEAAWGFHAGEWETSLMLACAPELVRMDRAAGEYPARLDDPGELRPEDAPATFAWMTQDLSRNGVMGDPTLATREKGARWLSIAAETLTSRILQLSGK
ncbi:MAG: creatininase family protein [Opitutaceae bacterium]|nr:creatininase family protein [Opitutaceae bacterium]